MPTSQQTPLLHISQLEDWLQIPTLEINAGEVVCLQGQSGSGKSRLLRGLADIDPQPLQLRLNNVNHNKLPANQWRQKLQYLPAEPVWWTETAEDMLSDEAVTLGEAIGLSKTILSRPITQLSTGERQRAAILRALSVNPTLLLLDEPTAALDQSNTLAVEALLQKWLAQGQRAIIMASHSEEQQQRLASALWTLDLSGRLTVSQPKAKAAN